MTMELKLDQDSETLLTTLQGHSGVKENEVAGVKTVLVVLSARGMPYDREALRHKIKMVYPEAAVFFENTGGKSIGAVAPDRVDLLIDFTGPGHRQRWLYSRKLRSRARFAVGRNSGFFRKKIYDRIFDEKARAAALPTDMLGKENEVHKKVLALAGIPTGPISEALPDRSKSIALELPPLMR